MTPLFASLTARWNRLPLAVRDAVRRGLHTGWQAATPLLLVVASQILAAGTSVGVSIPYLGIVSAVAFAVLTSGITALLAIKLAHLPVWADGAVRVLKTVGATMVGQIASTKLDVLHFGWGAWLTSGLVAGALALLRYSITLGWFGGPETGKVVAENLRTGKFLQAAAVGNGTTVDGNGGHDIGPQHAAPDDDGQAPTFEPELVDPDDPRLR